MNLTIQPTTIQLVPHRGLLCMVIDPAATLANADGAEMVAHAFRALSGSQGKPVDFTAHDLENLINESQVPAGKKMMLGVQ